MSDQLTERLNALLPKLVSDEFLTGTGIGNEIAFYVFDYLPEEELRIRSHVQFLIDQLPKQKPGMRISHINLLDLIVGYLEKRKLLKGAFDMQRSKGDDHLLKALSAVLDAEKVAEAFTAAAQPEEHELVLVSGVGSVWPILRSHNLLNTLHSRMGKTPLVLFYPGRYDGRRLKLFGKVKSNPYYRAFRLCEAKA